MQVNLFLNHLFLLVSLAINLCTAQNNKNVFTNADESYEDYLPLLQHKNIAILSNNTAMLGNKHLLDVLLENKIQVSKIFSPEHGFRGTEDAGDDVSNQIDKKSGLPIISLYGNKKKPSKEDLAGIDILLFDIQDVGVRFFTYISTLSYAMEACAENNINFMVLDRANPNASYIDGPVLETNCKSFVGVHPVPIVYGMTIGEYALMVNGEHWLPNNLTCKLDIIRIKNYSHHLSCQLNVAPSPNLNTAESISLYPSLCLFEGTVVSMGRGTKKPFTMYGHPKFSEGDFYFTPKVIKHMSSKPPYKNEKCRGYNLIHDSSKFNLQPLINAYKIYPDKENFFNSFFKNLAGTTTLKTQIENGISEKEIRETWQSKLNEFKVIRKKYLLYDE
jgi:uncharacterized protein YbbC (DUF1343 family)